MIESILNPNLSAVLVKGGPGTGKTLLSVELARIYGKAVYVSVTGSNQEAVMFHPALRELISEGKIVQVSFAALEKDSKIDDPNFGSIDALVESVIEQGRNLGESSLVVFDSWDAMLESSGVDGSNTTTDRVRLQKSLINAARENRFKLLFLSEKQELETTDYLFDAIVQLEGTERFDRRIRTAKLLKLSGSPITQGVCAFTLNEGKFSILTHPRTFPTRKYDIRFFMPRKEISESFFSTGSSDVDDFLRGGLKAGSAILLEIGPSVDNSQLTPLLASIQLNFISNGGYSVQIPTSEAVPEEIVESVRPYIAPSFLESSFRLGSYEGREQPWSFPLDPNSLSKMRETFWGQSEDMKREAQKDRQEKPCFWFVGLDTVESFYGPNELPRFSIMTAHRAKHLNDVVMFAMKQGFQHKQTIADICDKHLKIDTLYGALVIYSLKPHSGVHAIEYDFSAGFPQVSLTPIL